MLNNIQKYFLLNYPLLWNIRIVPILLGSILINLFFFFVGHYNTSIDFTSVYGYGSMSSGNGFIYFGAFVSMILYFIYWMILYSKNNAFKVFYPKSSGTLYLEWLLTFIVVFSMILFPYSLHRGEISKIKSYASKEATIEAVKLLNQIDILIPENKTNYYKEYPGKENMFIDKTTVDTKLSPEEASRTPIERAVEKAEQENLTYPDYPDFTQLSLLNYSGYNSFYIPSKYDLDLPDYKDVIKLLKAEDKGKISKLMNSFLALHSKHGLTYNLTVDKWLELVYNPRKYPVGDFNLINRFDYQNSSNKYNYYHNQSSKIKTGYYLQYKELTVAYEKILKSHMETGIHEVLVYFLWIISFALFISLLIFSFRVTSGKPWLIALIALGLISIIDLFFTLIAAFSFDSGSGSLFFYLIILLTIFIIELIVVTGKFSKSKSKGRSNILINHLIWFIPAVPAIIYTLIYIISNESCNSNEDNCIYKFMDKHIFIFLWANVLLTFISMGIFIRFILLKWKSLPEE